MIKSINIKNDIVLDTLINSDNASKLVEVAIMYYLGLVSEDYIKKYRQIEELKRELKNHE